MTDLNDNAVRKEMVRRYLNAETTIEEERELRDYYANTDNDLTGEEENVRWLLLYLPDDADYTVSKVRAEEFDKIMKRPSNTRIIRLIASAAAVAIVMLVFMLTTVDDKRIEDKPQVADNGISQEINVSNDVPNMKTETATKANTLGMEAATGRKATPHNYTKKAITHDNHYNAKENGMSVAELVTAVNLKDEQVESYQLQTAGEATIITKNLPDGSSSSYVVCQTDDGEGLKIIPINL